MVTKFLFSIAACAVFAACTAGGGGSAGQQPVPLAVKNPKPTGGLLVVYGDSLAYGTGSKLSSSRLHECLGRNLNWSGVAPLAAEGATTRDGVVHIDDLLKLEPRIVVISLGGNDVLQNATGQTFPQEDTFNNLRTVYRALVSKGVFVVQMGLNPPIAGAERLAGIKEVAEREGVLYVPDVLAGMWQNPEFMSDQIHPNDKGYINACNRLAAAMQPFM